MAENTSIEWAHDTLNLWWGCTKVSDGCKHCYAETLSNRYGRSKWGPKGIRQEVKSWRSTLNKISKAAKPSGERRRVFVQSMSDTFEGPETCGGQESDNHLLMCRLRSELVEAIHEHQHLDFLLLTKRPELVQDLWDEACSWVVMQRSGPHPFPDNVWIGTSVEDQKTADERIPHLLKIPAKFRFLSCEPLLGLVDLGRAFYADCIHCDGAGELSQEWDPEGAEDCSRCGGAGYDDESPLEDLHWVICGGESGPQARPMHPDWARSLRNQCEAAGVPFFFKQWGEFTPNGDHLPRGIRFPSTSRMVPISGNRYAYETFGAIAPRDVWMHRIGKKATGRLLDARTWDEFPEVTRG